LGTQTHYSSKLISHNIVLPHIISSRKDSVYLINLELKTTYFFSYKDKT
jgi:hypothetical protein